MEIARATKYRYMVASKSSAMYVATRWYEELETGCDGRARREGRHETWRWAPERVRSTRGYREKIDVRTDVSAIVVWLARKQNRGYLKVEDSTEG